ncbi:MAG: DUF86 domain-containing protein [Actinobacteria bacterium]|nr:DUF86 domain-containing protein [Actinomycetota bacterium]
MTVREFRESHDEIPWRQITGIGNVVTHHDATIQCEKVWDTLSDDMPALRAQFPDIPET